MPLSHMSCQKSEKFTHSAVNVSASSQNYTQLFQIFERKAPLKLKIIIIVRFV